MYAETRVGSSTDPAAIDVKLNDSYSISNLHYNWALPAAWHGHFNSDSSRYTIDSVDDYGSRRYGVVARYLEGSTVKRDTLTGVIHFSSECNTGEKSAQNQSSPFPFDQIAPQNQKDGLLVFPNPSDGTFVISGKLPATNVNAEIVLTDLSGKVILSDHASVERAYLSKTIHLSSDVPSGIYLARVKSDSKSIVFKIMKN